MPTDHIQKTSPHRRKPVRIASWAPAFRGYNPIGLGLGRVRYRTLRSAFPAKAGTHGARKLGVSGDLRTVAPSEGNDRETEEWSRLSPGKPTETMLSRARLDYSLLRREDDKRTPRVTSVRCVPPAAGRKSRLSFRDGPSEPASGLNRGPGPESKTAGQALDYRSPCAWVPGSRALPAPRNDRTTGFSASC